MLGLDVERFGKTQTALVDDGEVGAVTTVAESAQECGDFLAGEDMGKGFVALDLDLLPDVPLDLKVVAVEGAQGADGLVKSAGAELAFILQDDEKIQNALGAEGREIGVRIVGPELLDPAVVGPAGVRR